MPSQAAEGIAGIIMHRNWIRRLKGGAEGRKRGPYAVSGSPGHRGKP